MAFHLMALIHEKKRILFDLDVTLSVQINCIAITELPFDEIILSSTQHEMMNLMVCIHERNVTLIRTMNSNL